MALNLGELVAFLRLDRSDFDQNIDGANKSGAGFSKNAAKWGAAAAVGVGAAGKALYDIGATFDDVTDTIRVGTGATGDDLEGLVDVAKAVGKDVPAEFGAIGGTVADLNTRLGLTGDTLQTLATQFLEVGRITGEEIDINTVSQAFSAFGVEGEATTAAMDELYQISQATGLGINDLASSAARNAPALAQFGFTLGDSAALVGTLDKAGLDSNRTLSSLNRALAGFAKDGKDPQKAFRDTVTEMEGLIAAGKDAEAVDLAAGVFGTRGAASFVAAVKSGKVELDALMEGTGATADTIMGAAEDTADFAEQWQIFKNKALLELEPVATRVFNALGDAMTWMNDHGIPALEKFGGWVQRNKTWLMVLAGAFTALLVVTKAHAAVLAVQAAGGLVKYIGSIKIVSAVTKTWTAVQWAMNAALTANPIGLVIAAIALVVAAIILAYKKSDTFRAIVHALWDSLKRAGAWIADAFPKAVAAIWRAFKTAGDNVRENVGKIVGWVRRLPGRIKNAVSGMWDSMKQGVTDAKDWAISKLQELIDFALALPGKIGNTIVDAIPGGRAVADGLGNIPFFAEGGTVTGPTLAVIGEGGEPEDVVPWSKRAAYARDVLGAEGAPVGGTKNDYHFNVYANDTEGIMRGAKSLVASKKRRD